MRELAATARPWLAADGVVLLELARDQWPAAQQHAERAGWRTARHDHRDVPTCVLALRPWAAPGRTVVG